MIKQRMKMQEKTAELEKVVWEKQGVVQIPDILRYFESDILYHKSQICDIIYRQPLGSVAQLVRARAF